jgi:hypothetical protein
MDAREKRQARELKRFLKKQGSRRRRQFFKRSLVEDPEHADEADFVAFGFGECSSAGLNGMDVDATRFRAEKSWRAEDLKATG